VKELVVLKDNINIPSSWNFHASKLFFLVVSFMNSHGNFGLDSLLAT
jgi:hypothetical protein